MKIALVVLYLACDYRDKALTLLNKIPQNLLVYYCSQNPKLLDGKDIITCRYNTNFVV